MKFALINNNKTEAFKGAKGICPNCGSEVIAKCGDRKINHWSHKVIRNCDSWWETETEWHRAWKGNFPAEWQEVIFTDEKTSERHIADVRTSDELIVEFQHSFINSEERISRESFYKRMIWVIDGTRLKDDYPRFQKGLKSFCRTREQNLYYIDSDEKCFPPAWTACLVPVVFDFKGLYEINNPKDPRNFLFILYPATGMRERSVEVVSRETFVNGLITGNVFKQQELQKQVEKSTIQTNPNIPQRSSQYVSDRGRRLVKRRRF